MKFVSNKPNKQLRQNEGNSKLFFFIPKIQFYWNKTLAKQKVIFTTTIPFPHQEELPNNNRHRVSSPKRKKKKKKKGNITGRTSRLFRPYTSITEKYGCYLTAFQSELHTLLTLFRRGGRDGRRRSIDSIKSFPPAGHVRPSRLFWTFQHLRQGFQKLAPGPREFERFQVTTASSGRRGEGEVDAESGVHAAGCCLYGWESSRRHVQIGLSNAALSNHIRRITPVCFWIWRTRRAWHESAELPRKDLEQVEFLRVLNRSWKDDTIHTLWKEERA